MREIRKNIGRCLILLTLVPLVLTLWILHRMQLVTLRRIPVRKYEIPEDIGRARNLLNSPACLIPDLDPYHPSVANLVIPVSPLACNKSVPRLTYAQGNWLFFDFKAFQDFYLKPFKFNCCYRSLTNDNSTETFKFGKCVKFRGGAVEIQVKFIKVECKTSGKKIFYQNYHAIIQERKVPSPRAKYNILVLGIDSVSRLHMHRQLPRTFDYMKKKMNALEMFGYNKVADDTFPNLIPMLTGMTREQLIDICWKSKDDFLDHCPFIWKDFESKGYKTIYIEDTPEISTFEFHNERFANKPTEYYFTNFFSFGLKKFASLRNPDLCFGSETQVEVVLGILQEFVQRMGDKPYFAFTWTNSLSHEDSNLLSSADIFYEEVLKNLHEKGQLKDTILILVSNHGMRHGRITQTYMGILEQRLPMLMIYLPPRMKSSNPNIVTNVFENSRRLISPFDLYETMRHILNSSIHLNPLKTNYSEIGKSILYPILQNRTCSLAGIDEHCCSCQDILRPPQADEVESVSNYVLKYINLQLKEYKQCKKLRLKTVNHVYKKNVDLYLITLETSPNNATYQTTVKRNQADLEIIGEISRLNQYGNQADCVQILEVKIFCYCKEKNKKQNKNKNEKKKKKKSQGR